MVLPISILFDRPQLFRPSRTVALQSCRPSQHKFLARLTIGLLIRSSSLQRPQRFRNLHQNSPKPDTSRVRMVARRMKEIFVKGPHVQRNRDRLEI